MDDEGRVATSEKISSTPCADSRTVRMFPLKTISFLGVKMEQLTERKRSGSDQASAGRLAYAAAIASRLLVARPLHLAPETQSGLSTC